MPERGKTNYLRGNIANASTCMRNGTIEIHTLYSQKLIRIKMYLNSYLMEDKTQVRPCCQIHIATPANALDRTTHGLLPMFGGLPMQLVFPQNAPH